MTATPHRSMERTLVLRHVDRSLAGRHALMLSQTDRCIREYPITDPYLPRTASTRDMCLIAGANPRAAHVADQDLGKALALLVNHPSGPTQNAVETRFRLLARQTWTPAAATLRSMVELLSRAGIGVDFHDLAWAAHNWAQRRRHTHDVGDWAYSYARTLRHDTDSDENTDDTQSKDN